MAFAAVFSIAVRQSSKWSEKTFDAIVQEAVKRSDGEIRLIVERITEIYGSPVHALGISKETKLLGADGKERTIHDFQHGQAITVTIKDAFTEETPYYYSVVYEIRMIAAGE